MSSHQDINNDAPGAKVHTISAKILLVSANTMLFPYPVFPVGIAHIIGALHQHGHRTDHVDILASGGCISLENHLRENHYDVIGVSIRNIDTVDSATPHELLHDIAEVIDSIRTYSTAPVVLGGPGFSIMPERLLEHFHADYGVVGEGEEAFPLLVEKIMAGEKPAQRLFSKGLPAFPDCQPSYSPEVTPYYLRHGGMLNVQTKRGCNYGCAYCSYPTIEGKNLRHRPPGTVAEEIKRLARQYGARYIFFTDAVFNDADNRYLHIAEELIRSGNKLPWCAFFRPQNLDRETLRLLKRSGMAAMELGTDASTDTTLAGLNKGFIFDEVVDLNERIAAEAIPCAHFIMFGGPGETPETTLQGIENIDKLKNSVVFAYIGIRILPGTKIHRQALLDQLISSDTDLIIPRFYYSPQVAREFIDDHLRFAFRGKRSRIYPVMEREHVMTLLHKLGHDGPLWNYLID